MTDPITADSVLATAIDMEQTGREFYIALAQGCGDPRVAGLCRQLATAEAEHATVFQNMRKRLPAQRRNLPLSEEQAIRAHAMVKEFVVPRPALVSEVGLAGKLKDALNMAIQMEQDSVRFYEGVLRDAQPADAAVVNQIIDQEKSHLRNLKAHII